MKAYLMASALIALGGLALAKDGDDSGTGSSAVNPVQHDGGGAPAPSATAGYSAPVGGVVSANTAANPGYSAAKGYAAPSGASGAAARDPLVMQPDRDAGGVWRGTRDVKPSTFQEPPPSKEPLSLSSVRLNFTTVVQNYLAASSPAGYWRYKDPAEGALKLKFHSVDKASVEPVAGTVYRGQVLLRDIADGRLKAMDFTVDFAPTLWEVKKVALAAADDDAEVSSLPSRQDFASAVRRHVSRSARQTKGVFMVVDKAGKKTWSLKFDKLRARPLKENPDGSVTGCVEFRQTKGRARLDLDFQAQEEADYGWTIRKVTIHRQLDGKPST